MLRRLYLPGFILFSLIVGLIPSTPALAQAAQPLDRIVAVVNNGVVLQSELDNAVQQTRQSLQAQGRPLPPANTLRKRVLQTLVMRRLQLEVANRTGISVSSREVDSALQSIAQQNHMSMQQFQQAVKSEGMNYSQFRQRVHDELIIDKLRQQEVAKRVNVSEHEVNLYLQNQAARGKTDQSYHLSQILIAVPSTADSQQVKQARAKAQGLLKQIRHGASFSRLAISESDGQQAIKGGDLGWMQAGAMPTFFASVVPQMKPGQVSNIIRGPGGFHIVKLDGVRGGKREVVTEYHLLHIMLKPSQVRSEAQTQAQMENLYKQLKNGASFAKLARTYSDDSTSANQGGDLGWEPKQDFSQPFLSHVTQLSKGQISKPFRTPSGWHIVKMLGKRKRDKTEQMRREEARRELRRRKMNEQYQAYLRNLRAQAYIQYRLNNSSGIDQTSAHGSAKHRSSSL